VEVLKRQHLFAFFLFRSSHPACCVSICTPGLPEHQNVLLRLVPHKRHKRVEQPAAHLILALLALYPLALVLVRNAVLQALCICGAACLLTAHLCRLSLVSTATGAYCCL
jgi:hypothetical protein